MARPRRIPDWAVAAVSAALLVALGVLSADDARGALEDLGPTVGFLAALLVLADGCRRAGLFEALGAAMAVGARGEPRRLLALVFAAAAGTTAVLSLDATVVLLTPVVFATAARLRVSPRPHVYACSHLANSASLLLPVSNLTNLLALQASDLSFLRFAGLMTLPWLAALAVEWVMLSGAFKGELDGSPRAIRRAGAAGRPLVRGRRARRHADRLRRSARSPASSWSGSPRPARSCSPCTRARPPASSWARPSRASSCSCSRSGSSCRRRASTGSSDVADALVPDGTGLPELLAIAAIGALAANLVNNLPATLILLPATAAAGPGAVLAMLVGVNVGPNLTFSGSLATLLWRRVMHAHDEPADPGEFARLGALTVPCVLVASTAMLWLGLQIL